MSGLDLYLLSAARSVRARRGSGCGELLVDEAHPMTGALPSDPGDYPDTIQRAETGRPLRCGVKMLTIDTGGVPFTHGQPGWWASLDDPADEDGQLVDEDAVIRAAARREASGA